MDSVLRGSGDFVPRHELDSLSPTSSITVHLATVPQLTDLVAIARREIPGVSISEAGLELEQGRIAYTAIPFIDQLRATAPKRRNIARHLLEPDQSTHKLVRLPNILLVGECIIVGGDGSIAVSDRKLATNP